MPEQDCGQFVPAGELGCTLLDLSACQHLAISDVQTEFLKCYNCTQLDLLKRKEGKGYVDVGSSASFNILPQE
eukprot:scaffold244160_cov23-Tisochrysis_lutea.AAC.1